jgi:HSP20 family protein
MANIIRRNDRRNSNPDLAPMLSPAWDPFQIMRELSGWDPLRDLGQNLSRAFVPSFDVKETRDAYIFTADLPGVREEDLEINVTGNQLTVSGRREQEQEQEGEQYHAFERTYGAFMRTFSLPEGADPESVQAEFKDGVLRIVVGKRPEVQPRRISVLGAAKEAAKNVKERIAEVAESAKEKITGSASSSSGSSSGGGTSGSSVTSGTGAASSAGQAATPGAPKPSDKNKPEK